ELRTVAPHVDADVALLRALTGDPRPLAAPTGDCELPRNHGATKRRIHEPRSRDSGAPLEQDAGDAALADFDHDGAAGGDLERRIGDARAVELDPALRDQAPRLPVRLGEAGFGEQTADPHRLALAAPAEIGNLDRALAPL